MSYRRRQRRPLLGAAPFNLPGGFPGFPGGLPGPIPGGGPMPGPNIAVSIMPTTARWGDPVVVQGPFGGLVQGQVLVRFVGAPAQAMAMQGPFGGSVQVPVGAESGAVTVEVNGRIAGSANMTILPAAPVLGEKKKIASWKNVGYGSPLGGTMTYINDDHAYTRGAGAIAAVDGKRSGRRVALERARAAASVARDRAAVGVLNRRAKQVLGAINEDPGEGGGGGRTPAPKTTKRFPIGPRGTIKPGGVMYPPPPPRVTVPGQTAQPAAPTRPPRIKFGSGFGSSTITPVNQPVKPGVMYPPPPPQISVPPPQTSTYPSSGGGGAVGGGGYGSPVEEIPPDAFDLPPEEEMAPAPAATKPALGKYLMFGAIGIGAWLLLRR